MDTWITIIFPFLRSIILRLLCDFLRSEAALRAVVYFNLYIIGTLKEVVIGEEINIVIINSEKTITSVTFYKGVYSS